MTDIDRKEQKRFLCGNRVVVPTEVKSWRLQCPTCDYIFGAYRNHDLAIKRAVEQSDQPCPNKCGAR